MVKTVASAVVVAVVAMTSVALSGNDDDANEEPVPAAKTAPDKAYAKAKKEYQSKIRTKKPADRIAALKLLEGYPTGDAADLIYVTLLDDKSSEVRQAAAQFLANWREQKEVVDKLLLRLRNASRKSGMDRRAAGAIQVLGPIDDEVLRAKLLAYLDEFALQPNADLYYFHDMIDTQAATGDADESLRLFSLLAQTQIFGEHFGFRRCVVQGLMEVKDIEAITQLIELLPRFRGLVQADVIGHLISTTGENFGDDARKWKTWWAENHGKLNSRPKPVQPAPVNYGKLGEYYGIPICAKRVVFVLDTSLSMRGERIEAAKTELIRAINSLPPEVFFDVLAFDNVVRSWRPELVSATEQNRHLAINVVMEQPLNSRTCSFDALERAFELNPEVIFFLSDGAPIGGKIDAPAEILSTVGGWNKVRRITINSIGVGVRDPSAKVYADFLKGLATQNWGIYKPVN